MKNIKCRSCFFYRNEWCEKIVDSPDPEEVRDCAYFREMTNADKIRSMSDEELALWICGVYDIEEEHGKFINGIIIPGYAPHDIEEWLQNPAEEDKMPDCKYCQGDEVCVNADCPMCADFCPVVDFPGVCRFEEREEEK